MLIHRAPLLTPKESDYASNYHAYQRRLHAALSNPVSNEFFFKQGSLAEKRFTKAQYERDEAMFGSQIAGPRPDVGELPPDDVYEVVPRDEKEEMLAQGADPSNKDVFKRIERAGDQSLYLMVKDKSTGQWTLPTSDPAEGLRQGEGLHDKALRTVEEQLGGKCMDLWLVTRQPVGLLEGDQDKVG